MLICVSLKVKNVIRLKCSYLTKCGNLFLILKLILSSINKHVQPELPVVLSHLSVQKNNGFLSLLITAIAHSGSSK